MTFHEFYLIYAGMGLAIVAQWFGVGAVVNIMMTTIFVVWGLRNLRRSRELQR